MLSVHTLGAISIVVIVMSADLMIRKIGMSQLGNNFILCFIRCFIEKTKIIYFVVCLGQR